MSSRTFQVRGVIRATPRTRIISLGPLGAAFRFQAGQAVMVGLHGSLLRKPYSIASAPVEVARSGIVDLLLQLEDSGGLDPHLELADVGTPLDLEGPFGSFGLSNQLEENEILFVAGGTGIAPLRSMLIERLASSPRATIAMIYSARSPEELVYRSELEDLARAGRISVRFTVTREDNSETWTGRRGRIDESLLQASLPSVEALCLVCGPPQLVSDTKTLLAGLGVRSERILTESY